MATDIFQQRTTFGGGFNAHSAKVTLGALAGGRQAAGFSVEALGFNYQQQVVRIWDLEAEASDAYSH